MSSIANAKDRKCPKCGSTYIIGVQYWYGSPERYDGVSEWLCPIGGDLNNDKIGNDVTGIPFGCGYREGRWTGFELHPGEIEPRFGQVIGINGKYVKAVRPVEAKT